jgi:DNA-binding Lrp family transcriptional regulator
MALRLDPVDWRILKELQADGSMTNVALASRVGLSAPPCLRRVRALEQAGLIAGYTVLLDEAQLGFELTALAMVESDYMLKCVAKDLPAFQEFVLGELTAAPNVASVKTFLTIRRAKREAGVPITVPEK